MNLDLGKYEQMIEDNRTLLDTFDPEFDSIRQRIDALNSEIEIHKVEEHSDDFKNLSILSPGDITNMQSTEDPTEFTGFGAPNDSKISARDMPSPISRIIHSESSELLESAYPRRNLMRQSYSHLESKLSTLEKSVGNMVKNEAQLKGEISRLKIERDGYKKMLEDGQYHEELLHTIANLSTALLTNSKIDEVKFNQQVVLKNLIDDSLTTKIKSMEKRLNSFMNSKVQMRELFFDELKRSNSTLAISKKYIDIVQEVNELYSNEDNMNLQKRLHEA